MHVPEHFSEKNLATLHEWIERWNFGTLVTSHRGRLETSQIPFLLDRERNVLLGHVARQNRQWMSLLNAEDLLVQFNGPHAYVSPAWYSQPGGVPTWNYVSVQVRGKAELVKTESETIDLLRRLSDTHEARHNAGWHIDHLDPAQLKSLCQNIVCFRIQIGSIEGKAKLSQNRSKKDQLGVCRELAASQDTMLQALSKLMVNAFRQRKGEPEQGEPE